jgi:hypothetical protein
MPTRTLQIQNGPGFKRFVLNSSVIQGTRSMVRFTLDQPDPRWLGHENEKNMTRIVVSIEMIARNEDSNEDEFSFVAHLNGGLDRSLNPPVRVNHFIYYGTYNVVTRKGV